MREREREREREQFKTKSSRRKWTNALLKKKNQAFCPIFQTN